MHGAGAEDQSQKAALRSTDPRRQFDALIALTKAGGTGAVPDILPVFGARDDEVRAAAVRAVGYLGGDRPAAVGPSLVAMLADADEVVRAEAVEAFGTVHYEPAVDELIRMLREDDAWLVRASAAETLGHYPGRAGRELLACIRDDDEEIPVCRYALESLLQSDESLMRSEISALVEEYGDDPEFGADVRMVAYRLGDRAQLGIVAERVASMDEHAGSLLLNMLGRLAAHPVPPALVDDMPVIDGILSVIALRWPLQRPHVGSVRDSLPSAPPESGE
ncbi:HEAT repeat domain-containing protein [Nocardia sp. NPDC004568]|uniref:HEAT repeat domain-containing protein n=1 Tax=Nocardia sp. NPDC004568 TaxID=3154551 RepID=UPI0033BDE454